MRFNNDQREGLAKVLDTIAAAFIIGVTAAVAIDHKIGMADGILLVAFAISLISIAITLRGMKEQEDVV